MNHFFAKAPAAWAGVIQAVMALVAVYWPDFPVAGVLLIVAAITGLSFKAQAVENSKTEAAYYTIPEDVVE